MKVKSLQKQLMAAIAMVLVAAIALSSATYAWFVNNAQVTATNVNVQAATAYSLLISQDNKTWGTTTQLDTLLTKLTPVSTIGDVADAEITLTQASSGVEAVGIGDGTKIAVGDVRFVTNTVWKDNYVTGVSEVSKTSKTAEAKTDDQSTYFYSETVYLKAAQAGKVYLDKNGIGIVWAEWDETNSKLKDAERVTLSAFMDLNKITPADSATDEVKKNIADYNEQLTSAQALLKTLRVGLLVVKNEGKDDVTYTWHEYQLATGDISTAVNTTLNEDSAADGVAKAVTAVYSVTPEEGDPVDVIATKTEPTVAAIKNNVDMTSTSTIETVALAGSQTTLATVTDGADEISEMDVNETVKVDVYVWMEGCDGDTIAANINEFSGTGVRGLQLGFCLGQTESN